MTWAPEKTAATNKPGMPAMARAYARWVNAHGGIAGHKLEVLTCNDHNDSIDAAHCAERAAEENVVAVVGSYSQHSRSFLSPLESAGIPYIGGYGVTDDEFTSPLSYPVNGGQPALLAGLGEQLGGACGPVSLVRPDTIGRRPAPGAARLRPDRAGPRARRRPAGRRGRHGVLQPAPGRRSRTRPPIRPSAAAWCPPSATAPSTFMDSFRRAGTAYPKVRTGTVLGSVDQSQIDATGGTSSPYEGAYVTGWYPAADDAALERDAEGASRSRPSATTAIDPADPGVQTTWIAYSC